MFLVKGCEKSRNIRNGTIKLGSLSEYRATEIQEIADKEEGVLRFKLTFDGTVTINAEWFESVFAGMYKFTQKPPIQFPGFYRYEVEKMTLVSHTSTTVTLRDTTIFIYREALNSFIYCMSSVATLEEGVGIFPKYDDRWYIPEASAPEFGSVIGNQLLDALKKAHGTDKPLISKDIDVDKVSLFIKQGKVRYTPREIHVTELNVSAFYEFIELMMDMSFIKPSDPFVTEKEYRFHYTFILDNKIIVPKQNYLILDSEPLIEYVI